MPATEDPGQALRRLLHVDRTFADEPRRLRRGLIDLLPEDDRAVRLLTTAAEAGVPALIKSGEIDHARQRLLDDAGLRPEIADWIVRAWVDGLQDRTPEARAVPSARVTAPDAVRLAAWPDGVLLVLAQGGDGIFAAAVDPGAPGTAEPAWRQVANPQSARSRDVAATVHGERPTIVWSDVDGAYACDVHRQGAELLAGPARLVIPTRDGQQMRHPIGALAVDETSLDVFWSPDRRQLRRSTWRPWSADGPDLALPECCRPEETVSRLDIGRSSPQVAWLVVRTSRGRVLVSRWDVARDDLTSWVPATLPGTATDVAVAGSSIFAPTGSGAIWMLSASDVYAGRTIEPDTLTGPDRPVESIGASLAGGGVWLAGRIGGTGFLTGPSGAPRSLWTS